MKFINIVNNIIVEELNKFFIKKKIWRVTTKYKHTHTAFVEALNKVLTEQLFKVQVTQELNNPEKVSSTWVKHLYGLVDYLNETKTQMIGMSLKEVIELKEVPLVNRENYPPEDTLPEENMMANVKEQPIEYGPRKLTD